MCRYIKLHSKLKSRNRIINRRLNKILTRKLFVDYLNSLAPSQGSEEWIIGGTTRTHYMLKNQYGEALRKYDPIGFEVAYDEWKKMSLK